MGRDVRNIAHTASLNRGLGVIAGAVLADLCAVAIYVGVGRASHSESLSLHGFLTTGWPFLIGVVGGYIGVILTRWPMISVRGGTVVTVKCLIIGLVLRYGVQRNGTPLSYIVVTVVVLAVLMMGWRLAVLARVKRTHTGARQASLV